MVGEVTQTIHGGFLDPVQFGCAVAHSDNRKDWEDDVKDRIQSCNLREVSLLEGLTDSISGELSNYGCWESRRQSENVQKDLSALSKRFPICIEEMEVFRQKSQADTGFFFHGRVAVLTDQDSGACLQIHMQKTISS